MITESEFHLKIYSKPISTEYLEEFETDEENNLNMEDRIVNH